jgi:TetR/AcrR family transcriptional regulator, tetracycline repressor protein
MSLTRDHIVAEAVALLNEDGLAKLSLRKLAARLGISAPTLYWHVKDKRELLDLMVEKIFKDYREKNPLPLESAPGPWHERVGWFMRQRYQALIETRDAPLVMAGNRPTDAMLPYIERWLSMWIEVGFSHQEAFRSILAVSNFIIGSALEYQAEAERAAMRKHAQRVSPLDGKDTYPHLKQAVIEGRSLSDPHAPFETGLALLVEGLRRRREELTASKKGGPDGAAPLEDR